MIDMVINMVDFEGIEAFLAQNENFIRERVVALMEERQVNAAKLSGYVDRNVSYIHNFLAGQNNPSFEVLVKLCFFFNLTLEEFFQDAPEACRMAELRKFYSKLTEREREIFDQYVKLVNERD